MARDPLERFESVDQIRIALQGFLTHRGSRRVAERADAAAAALQESVARGDGDEAYAHFAECRFGYRAALEAWPQNDEAARALEASTRTMLEWALSRSDVEAAGRLLSSLIEPDPELVARVEALRRVRDEERGRLARFEAESSQEAGRRVRLGIATFLGLFWTVGPHLAMANESLRSLASLAVSASTTVVVAGLLFLWGRRWLAATRLNRGLFALVFVTLAAQLLLVLGGTLAGWSYVEVHRLYPLLWCVTVTTGASLLLPAAWPAAVVMALAFLAGLRWPGLRGWWMSASNLVLLLTFLRVNRNSNRETAPERGE